MLPPSTKIPLPVPLVELFRTVTAPMTLKAPIPISACALRVMLIPLPWLFSTVVDTMIAAAELSILIPLPRLLRTMTGPSVAEPSWSWPIRMCEPRFAWMPVWPSSTVVLVMNSTALLAAIKPLLPAPLMSASSTLPWELFAAITPKRGES